MDTKLKNSSVKIEKMSMADVFKYTKISQMPATINHVKSFSVGTQTQEIKVISLLTIYLSFTNHFLKN